MGAKDALAEGSELVLDLLLFTVLLLVIFVDERVEERDLILVKRAELVLCGPRSARVERGGTKGRTEFDLLVEGFLLLVLWDRWSKELQEGGL